MKLAFQRVGSSTVSAVSFQMRLVISVIIAFLLHNPVWAEIIYEGEVQVSLAKYCSTGIFIKAKEKKRFLNSGCLKELDKKNNIIVADLKSHKIKKADEFADIVAFIEARTDLSKQFLKPSSGGQKTVVKFERPIDFSFSAVGGQAANLLLGAGVDPILVKKALKNSRSNELEELFRLYNTQDISGDKQTAIKELKSKMLANEWLFNPLNQTEFMKILHQEGKSRQESRYARYVKYEYIKSRDYKSCPVSRKEQKALGIRNRNARGCYKVSEVEVFKNYNSPTLNLTECANKHKLFGYNEFTPVENKRDDKFRCEFSGGNIIKLSKK